MFKPFPLFDNPSNVAERGGLIQINKRDLVAAPGSRRFFLTRIADNSVHPIDKRVEFAFGGKKIAIENSDRLAFHPYA